MLRVFCSTQFFEKNHKNVALLYVIVVNYLFIANIFKCADIKFDKKLDKVLANKFLLYGKFDFQFSLTPSVKKLLWKAWLQYNYRFLVIMNSKLLVIRFHFLSVRKLSQKILSEERRVELNCIIFFSISIMNHGAQQKSHIKFQIKKVVYEYSLPLYFRCRERWLLNSVH